MENNGKQGKTKEVTNSSIFPRFPPFSLVFHFFPRRFWSVRAWRTWAGYVHWRLETYGVYYPAGKFNWKAFRSLLRQTPGYLHWVSDMDATRKKSPTLR